MNLTNKKMEKIIIYTNETCPYCKQIKEKLTEKNIEFENRLTSEFKDEWMKIINLIGMAQVPTVFYKDTYFAPGRDYGNADGLVIQLENFKGIDETISLERYSLERIKTLTYHIQTAFGRTDQLLRKIENKLNTKEDEHKSTD